MACLFTRGYYTSDALLLFSERYMIIAIDYDNTLSLKPEMWKKILPIYKEYGFRLYVVTLRYAQDGGCWGIRVDNSDMDWVLPFVDKVIFCCGLQKRPYCTNLGISPAFWIDDLPETIIELPNDKRSFR